MLIINKKLYKKGFSLIELMVAVVILALAIFGIFHAYSVGFMGMADARARTVATNYAREAMEDIKNMDFDKIPTSESSSVTVNGITYNRQVIVQENPNLKRVITTVTWEDRNGKQKMVETDMVVHFIETTAGDATRIMLYADPYNVLVLPPGGDDPENMYKYRSTITAVIKDTRGNTIMDWDKNVIFSLTGSGGLSSTTISLANPITITPDKFVDGKAIITFTSSTAKGEEIITASTEGLTPDSVTINVYDPGVPVKINLTANPYSMLPNESAKSVITATIVDAGGTKVGDATNEILFSIAGPGSFSSSTPETTKSEAAINGEIGIDLFSNFTPGTITVTASASNLEPGVVVVLTGGYITLSASPIEVPNYEESVITVTTKDVSDVPIKYVGTINITLASTGGSGTLSSNSSNFDEDTYELTFNGDNSSETVIFTASFEGTVNVTAEDSNAILTSNTLTLTVTEKLTPHHIIVYAIPVSIPAGGAKTLITAKVMTEGNVKITSYTNDITFTTTAGSFTFGDDTAKIITLSNTDENYNEGVATVELYSSDISETAEITASSTVSEVPELIITGSTEVGFYIGPDHILLSAVPQNILVGGETCIVTAEIVDYKGTLISNYNKDISFSISPHPDTINFLEASTSFLTKKVKKGIATIILVSGMDAGTAVIYAFSENLFGSLNIPVGISLTLVENSVDYTFDTNIGIVSFDITIVGAPLTLEEMQVSWPPSTEYDSLNKIIIFYTDDPGEGTTIFDADTSVGSITYTGDSNTKVADVNVNNISLPAVTHTVKMYFNENMSGKTLKVIFNPNSGYYPVEFIVPSSS